MKGVIYYYSSSGNTLLACNVLAEKIVQAELILIDVVSDEKPSPESFDVLGFAFPTHYLGVEEVFLRFVDNLEVRQQKPVFLLNTFGMMQGKALKIVGNILEQKGLRVIGAHGLAMPENYPPFIAKGWTGENMPGEKQVKAFHAFIGSLSEKLRDIGEGGAAGKEKIKIGLFNSLMGVKTREKILKGMGELKLDSALCRKCGKCEQVCSYGAVKLENYPVFDSAKCRGCWSCFNQCTRQAIHTDKVAAAYQYKGPSVELVKRRFNSGGGGK